MIGLIAAWAVKRGLATSESAARPFVKAGVVALVAALILGGFLLWDHFDDKAAVGSANLERERDEAVVTLESQRRADAGDQVRAEARLEQSERTRSELETIHAEDPNAAAAPASRGARAVARRLPQS